jgi:hypothetical protein
MNICKLHYRKWKTILLIISLVSILSISSTYVLAAEPIFLPLIYQNPSPTPTASVTPTATGTPQAPGTQWVIVSPYNNDKGFALARFAKSYNAAGRPVMQIYPGDTAPDSERIKIPRGERVLVVDTPITADGGGKYWRLVDYKGRKGEELYLRTQDITRPALNEPLAAVQ